MAAAPLLWVLLTLSEAPAATADFDKDGIPDVSDDCPTDPGDAANQGCKSPPPTPARPPPTPAAKEVARVEGDQLVLPRPVEFQTGSARLLPSAGPLIEAMAAKLAELKPGQMLLVRGHTDNRGGREANLLLSRRRAEAVAKALVQAGVGSDRVKSEGKGPDEPVAPNTSDDGRAKNRRVEFKLVDKKK
jgi:OmpA-OmpF porin, OOP family